MFVENKKKSCKKGNTPPAQFYSLSGIEPLFHSFEIL
jgi:hypothetical protein